MKRVMGKSSKKFVGSHGVSGTRYVELGPGIGFPIFELPIHLIFEILAKLPIKYVLRCSCVCKAFSSLIRDPYFSDLYLSRAPTSFLVRQTSTTKTHIYAVDSLPSPLMNRPDLSDYNHQVLPKKRVAQFFEVNPEVVFVNSCNGFLCLYEAYPGDPRYYVCNPILDEFVVMPRPPSFKHGHGYLDYSAFGFSPGTKKFKIVRFVSKMSNVMAEVLTMGWKSWRLVDGAPAGRPQGSLDPFVNGALHWVCDRHRSSEMLCSFDLDSEKFVPIPVPSHMDADFIKKTSWINVGTLDNCLCLSYAFEGVSFEVWVMNEYGLKESWTKKFAIDINFYCGLQIGNQHQPIGFTREGDLWLNCDSCSLVSYCPRKRSFKVMIASRSKIEAKIEAIPYVPSFISLRNVTKELEEV
uniref:F-box protein interaction domain protein n=1 Tax=Rhizophora mucronata TaxID=61149 RepID=A0A2P2L6E8_RHIMU